jgi:peptide/nickel transport system substrate-binding protein
MRRRWNILMSRTRRATLVASAVAIASLTLAACGGSGGGGSSSSASTGSATGFNAAITNVVNASDKTGGTLRLGASGDCDSWDGANQYYGWCWDMGRLYSRNLLGFKAQPGAAEFTPDMATDLPTHNADFTSWTFTLRDGLKWEDGTPVTTADFKYGMERLFATDIFATGAGAYFTCILSKCDASGVPAYKGPYADPTGGLSNIVTTDKTITYNLVAPQPEFQWLMALPTAGPVKQSADKGKQYTLHPLSNGPFKFETYQPGKSVTWVRNPNWDQATDPIRKPKVDKVTLTIFSNPDDIDQRVQAGDIDLVADGSIQATFQTKILSDPTLKAQADNPNSGGTRYLVVFQTVAPLTNADCRKAIFYAINKVDLRLARGGTTAGEIAGSMTPGGIAGHESTDQYNPYPNGTDFKGDVTKAKEALTACGQPNGFTINEAYVPGGKADKVLAATQAALAKVGITVKPLAGEQASYYSTLIGSPATVVSKNIGMAQAGWGYDYPSVNGFFKNIVSTQAIKPSGTSNYASLSSPTVDQGLEAAGKATTAAEMDAAGKQVNHGVMDAAVYLPYLWDNNFLYRSPRLTNVYCAAATQNLYDYVSIGTTDGK